MHFYVYQYIYTLYVYWKMAKCMKCFDLKYQLLIKVIYKTTKVYIIHWYILFIYQI